MRKAIMMVLGIFATVCFIGVSVYGDTNGKMASQNWVNYKIAQQETNTQATVDTKISSASSNGMISVEYKLSVLKAELEAAISQATEILSKSNTPTATSNAYNVIKTSAGQVSDYYMNSCLITF